MEKSTDLTHLTSAGPWAGLIFLEHGVKAEDLRCSEELWKKNPLNPAFDASTAPPNGWRGAPERMQICLQNTCRIGLARILVDGIWTRYLKYTQTHVDEPFAFSLSRCLGICDVFPVVFLTITISNVEAVRPLSNPAPPYVPQQSSEDT
ncbi:hypothetical protein C8R46DRAFT_1027770 [Mycena filopes]|nr:hypothetical protein C8R46DRAFT_1027770 [Mycena filopes]